MDHLASPILADARWAVWPNGVIPSRSLLFVVPSLRRRSASDSHHRHRPKTRILQYGTLSDQTARFSEASGCFLISGKVSGGLKS